MRTEGVRLKQIILYIVQKNVNRDQCLLSLHLLMDNLVQCNQLDVNCIHIIGQFNVHLHRLVSFVCPQLTQMLVLGGSDDVFFCFFFHLKSCLFAPSLNRFKLG